MTKDDKDRLKRLLNPPPAWSDWEISMILVGRPVSYVLVRLLHGVGWVTPNRVTILAFLSMLAASALVLWSPDQVAAICALLTARMVLDDTDGMLARFRGQCSVLGSYLDKVTDMLGFFALFGAVGVRAAEQTGHPAYFVLSLSGACSLLLMGYVKHVAKVEELQAGVPQPETKNASNDKTFPPFWTFLWKLVARVPAAMESDLVMAGAVGALTGRWDILAWYYGALQGIGVLVQLFRRGATVAGVDRFRRERA